MAFKREYVDPNELEECLEKFEDDGYSIVAVNIYNGYLVPKDRTTLEPSKIRTWGYEVILRK